MARHLNWSGLIVAGIGFFLTRFTVTLVITEGMLRFYLAGIVPLALGLGLAAFGVALTVADIDPAVAQTTALWCLIGLGTMVLFSILTAIGSTPAGFSGSEPLQTGSYFSTFLIGGSVGGTLTGLYAASNRRQRGELRQQTNRLFVINRLLRHEVLNAVTIIRGYATTQDAEIDAATVIEERSDTIEETIDEVKHLTRQTGEGQYTARPIDIERTLEESTRWVTDRYPDAEVAVEPIPDGAHVRADEHLAQVFSHLLENAIVHAEDRTPTVSVTRTSTTVRVSVADEGAGLPAMQRELLEAGEIGEFDDPTTGFGLNIVRLLVEGYDGTIETDVTSDGTTITVVLPRSERRTAGLWPSQRELGSVRPAVPHLFVTLVAAVIAGIPYGLVSEALGGSIAGIGVFYGAANPIVGWLTHEFHSIVFGFVFVSLRSLAPERYRTGVWPSVAIGLGWGAVLWLGAAGIVAPVWLRLLGVAAPLPNLSGTLLVNHLVWGGALGLLAAWGDRFLTPQLDRVGERLDARTDRH